MSHKRRPTEPTGEKSLSATPLVERVAGAVRTHVHTWASRYVEMRVEAVRN
ncbi:MAG: hypothetical protein ABEJ68_08700 [Halobacteriaceae archaeon]